MVVHSGSSTGLVVAALVVVHTAPAWVVHQDTVAAVVVHQHTGAAVVVHSGSITGLVVPAPELQW